MLFSFIRKQKYLLLFCWSQVFFSAPGQTFFIALFITPIFSELGESVTKFAAIYSSATLIASLFLNAAGRFIDRVPLKIIVTINAVLFSFGCFLLATTTSFIQLFCAFFLLRYIGQGVFLLTGVTTIGKAFSKNRGKALSFLTLGFPASEIIFPPLALACFSLFGWRHIYAIVGLGFLVVVLPLQLLLLKKARYLEGKFLQGEEETSVDKIKTYAGSRTLGEAFKELRFHIIILASCAPALIVTGVFFHYQVLFTINQWPIESISLALIVYAVSKGVGSLLVGPYVDKNGPIAAFSATIGLLGIGAITLGSKLGVQGAFVSFCIMGAALGMSMPVLNVIWPALYGTKHLGSIRGYIGTFRNGITAFGPMPIAIAIDHQWPLNTLLVWTGIVVLCMTVLPWVALKENSRFS